MMIEKLEAMLTQGMDSALLRFGLGNAYFQLKNFQSARTHLKKAVSFDEHYTAAWKLYARALDKLDRLEEARQAYIMGIAIANEKGDKQAEREMQVFLNRVEKKLA
jgi:Tfp pilus assembly protein PilF